MPHVGHALACPHFGASSVHLFRNWAGRCRPRGIGGRPRHRFHPDGHVVLRGSDDTIKAVWDVKTGNAELTNARRQEIRDELGLSDDVPIIELHICRGVSCKLRKGTSTDVLEVMPTRHPDSRDRPRDY